MRERRCGRGRGRRCRCEVLIGRGDVEGSFKDRLRSAEIIRTNIWEENLRVSFVQIRMACCVLCFREVGSHGFLFDERSWLRWHSESCLLISLFSKIKALVSSMAGSWFTAGP